MTPLEERFHQLKADIEALKIRLDEQKIDYDKKNALYDLVLQLDYSPKNQKFRMSSQFEVMKSRFEYLRANNDILKRISENISNSFEDEINGLDKKYQIWFKEGEKIVQRFLKSREDLKIIDDEERLDKTSSTMLRTMVDEAKQTISDARKANDEGEKISKELSNLSSRMNLAIRCFESTIDYLDGNKLIDTERKEKPL